MRREESGVPFAWRRGLLPVSASGCLAGVFVRRLWRARVRLAGASIESGARAKPDSKSSSRACALRGRRGVASFPALGRAYRETMSSSLAALEPHAHSAIWLGDF